MSSREGNIITARGLLEDLIEKASEKNEDPIIAEQVALGAVKYMILRQAPGGDIVFDPEQSLSLEGDSGPYLQYALVRARSVLSQAPQNATIYGSADRGVLAENLPEDLPELARLIARFPAVARRAGEERSPHHVAQYLTQLAGEWNSFYAKERIIGSEGEAWKLALARAFAGTMEAGLALLAIPAPERM